ncbi:LacI family DNA-binding transcriptional regulator [Solicola gregarius]|uniref:LacI family transcriptional regulator n=1 Tax=Solicola gregarius TaxID=2908642 RepID=A0AA46TI63_9ACTN|nr:LacI family DNA-binding transcriptional regulator [Solicola gregarius]UYM05799.1 LacI family transcriptional regulator [Solicola gregarius]
MTENRRSPVTLEAVAARAGVSRATASRVLNGSTRVSDDARDSVRAAADELGYVPNRAARSLVTRQSDALAFVVAESEDVFFADPFFAPVLRGAHDAAAERGRPLLFVIVANDEDRARLEQYAAGGHVDGVMFVSVHAHDTLPRRVHDLGVPVVLAGRPPRGRPALPYVSSDNVGGGEAAARVLLERGCTEVATITGPDDMTVTTDRLEGFRRGVAAGGLDLPADRIVSGYFSMDGGRAAMAQLLEA